MYCFLIEFYHFLSENDSIDEAKIERTKQQLIWLINGKFLYLQPIANINNIILIDGPRTNGKIQNKNVNIVVALK